MTNGTLLVNDDEPDENGYLAGKVITITNSPSVGYKFDEEYSVKAWKAGDPTTVVEVTTGYSGYNITMPAYDIVISARFTELVGYTITYHVNGVETPKTVYENERIQPSDPQVPAGTSFIGWTTSDIATYSETEPTLFETGDYPTSDVELYAVFRYADQSKWTPVYNESDLSTDGSDRVIFAYYLSGNPTIMTYYDSWHFESTVGEMNDNAEIVNIPTSTTIFRPEKANDTWKFYFDYNGSETTLADYDGNNLFPQGLYGYEGIDTWNICLGFVYDNNDYIGLRNNNTFNIHDSNQARLYKEVKPQGSLDAYFTEVLSVSGNESMNEDMEARNLLINEGASYTVNGGKLTVLGFIKNIENTPANFIFTDGAQLIHNNTGVLATMKKNIAEANTRDSKWSDWYTISSPLANSVEFANVENLIPTTVETDDYDLYRLDEKYGIWENARVNEGEAFTTIDKGRGYLYARKDKAQLAFAGEINVADVECTLTNDAAHGFNLIGNPFMQNIELANVTGVTLADGFYVLSNEGDWGSKLTGIDIKPLQGFLVQATTVGTATIEKPAASSKGERSNEQNTNIEMIVSNSNHRDNAYAVFGEGIGLNKINHRNTEAPMLYVPQDGEDFAIAFMDENTTVFPLNFKAMTTGNYSISLKATDDINTLVLVDNMTGVETNMLLEGNYSFIGSPADNDSRFTVKLSISHNSGQTDSEHFVYQNGSELVINGEGTLHVFDVLGRVVISEEVHSQTVNVGGLTTGAYIVRMTGENVRTQKIVLK